MAQSATPTPHHGAIPVQRKKTKLPTTPQKVPTELTDTALSTLLGSLGTEWKKMIVEFASTREEAAFIKNNGVEFKLLKNSASDKSSYVAKASGPNSIFIYTDLLRNIVSTARTLGANEADQFYLTSRYYFPTIVHELGHNIIELAERKAFGGPLPTYRENEVLAHCKEFRANQELQKKEGFALVRLAKFPFAGTMKRFEDDYFRAGPDYLRTDQPGYLTATKEYMAQYAAQRMLQDGPHLRRIIQLQSKGSNLTGDERRELSETPTEILRLRVERLMTLHRLIGENRYEEVRTFYRTRMQQELEKWRALKK